MTLTSEVREVPANLLTIDPRVQRASDPRRVKKLADNWDDLMVGVLTVSHRQALVMPIPGNVDVDEEFVVLDGQTRLEAFRLVCNDDSLTAAPMVCQVFESLTLKEEAQIFLQHNDRRAVTPRDRYRLAVTAGEEWALDIRDIAGRTGWYVQGSEKISPKARLFSAVGAAEKIYRMDEGRSLRKTFDVIDAAWQSPKGAVCSETIFGLGLLYARYEEEINGRSLVQKLAKLGVNKFISGVADRRRANPGMSIQRAASDWTVDLYNVGRRTRRIG
jgi:hypothetical protein